MRILKIKKIIRRRRNRDINKITWINEYGTVWWAEIYSLSTSWIVKVLSIHFWYVADDNLFLNAVQNPYLKIIHQLILTLKKINK